MKRVLLIVVFAACGHRDTSGAVPAVETPVGPVPGPGVERSANPNPYDPSDRAALADGFRLFQRYNCAGCHGDHGGGGMGPSLRDPVWLYGEDDAHIFDSIAEGRAHGMPAWGVRLPEDHVWRIVTYIRSLRTPDEPEAPK